MGVGGVGSTGSSFATNEPQAAADMAATAAITLQSDQFKNKPALAQVASGSGEIAFGARGDGAKAIQGGLVKLGLLRAGSDDGIYGRGTQTAVATFQRQNGLNASGNVDSATLAKMDEKIKAQGGASAPPRPTGPVDKSMVFVGMGDGAKSEAQHLSDKTGGKVKSITDTKNNDEVTLKVGAQTKTYDLKTREGCDNYAKDMGLTGAKATEVGGIIHAAGDDARDETAQLAKVFHEAEGGKRQIERMVISGHSVGGGVWGDNNGYLQLDTISDLAKSFPAAASQVQDFMVAGCYSGGESAMDKFQGIFPNLKTAWAYTGSAPGTYSGALPHLSKWEQGTRGSDPSTLSRNLVAGTRKGENVAVWTATKGYDDGQPMRPVADLKRDFDTRRGGFDTYMSGNSSVADTQSGPVREYYNSIQRLLQHPQTPAADRPALEQARDQTIRLNFYDSNIKGKFQNAHAAKVNAGFAAVGLPAPDFSKLSRKDALQKVAEFERALESKNPKPAAAQTLRPLLTDGLRDLKPSQIPNTWV